MSYGKTSIVLLSVLLISLSFFCGGGRNVLPFAERPFAEVPPSEEPQPETPTRPSSPLSPRLPPTEDSAEIVLGDDFVFIDPEREIVQARTSRL